MTSTPQVAETLGDMPVSRAVGDGPASAAALTETMRAALGAGTRGAFTALLSEDVRWGGEERGAENECTNRHQAGDHYAELRSHGLTMHLENLQPAESLAGHEVGLGAVFVAHIQLRSADPGSEPSDLVVRLTRRGQLISDIAVLNQPCLEVLYFQGCPHFETFVPHLRRLLTDHGITTPIFLTSVNDDEDARRHRFLGSPSVRVGGHDVDATVADGGQSSLVGEAEGNARFGMQCRLYVTADGGRSGTPQDQWILDALTQNDAH